MTIYYSIPYDTEKNIGVYYNNFMRILPSGNDYACFIDGDAVFTYPFFGHQLVQVINKNPQYGLLLGTTNRIGCDWQLAPGTNRLNDDMAYHRDIGIRLAEKYGSAVVDVSSNTPCSGFLLLVQKRLWAKTGGFKEQGMLTVDNDFFCKVQQLGEKIGLMPGVYLYHWYRGGGTDISHLMPSTGPIMD